MRIFDRAELLFLSIILLVQLVACRVFIAHIDEGMLLSSAMRVAEGDVLYRDFFEFWTPGSIYVTGWLFQLFGSMEWVRQTLLALLQFGVVVCVFYILKKLRLSMVTRVLFCTLIVCLGLSLLYLSHHWFGMFFLLLTLCSLMSNQSNPKRILISGLLSGITCLFMQYEGAIAVIACLTLYLIDKAHLGNRLARAGLFLMPIGILFVSVAGIFYLLGALDELIYSVVLFPISQYQATNTGGPGILWALTSLSFILGLLYLRIHNTLETKVVVVAIFAVVSQLMAIVITGQMRIALFGLFAYIVIYYALVDLIKGSRISDYIKARQIPDLLTIISKRKGSAFLSLVFATSSIWTGIFVGIFVFGLLMLQFGNIQRIETSAGSVAIAGYVHGRVNHIVGLVTALRSDDPQAKFYFGPYSSYYYFLISQQNPTSYSQLTPNYNPETMIEEATGEIVDSDVEYVIYLPNESPFYEVRTLHFDQRIGSDFILIEEFDNYSLAKYTVNQNIKGFLYKRIENR